MESTEEVWKEIEMLHDPEKNRVANTYAITLNNGVTYLYTATEDGILVSIDDWFEGYVAQYGTKESGFPYAVIISNKKLVIKEIIGNCLSASSMIDIRKSSPIYKLLSSDYHKPFLISYCYKVKGEKYVVLSTPSLTSYVFQVGKNEVADKIVYKQESKIQHSPEFHYLCRLAYKPYNYILGYFSNFASIEDPIRPYVAFIPKHKAFPITNIRIKYIKVYASDDTIYIYGNKKPVLKLVLKLIENNNQELLKIYSIEDRRYSTICLEDFSYSELNQPLGDDEISFDGVNPGILLPLEHEKWQYDYREYKLADIQWEKNCFSKEIIDEFKLLKGTCIPSKRYRLHEFVRNLPKGFRDKGWLFLASGNTVFDACFGIYTTVDIYRRILSLAISQNQVCSYCDIKVEIYVKEINHGEEIYDQYGRFVAYSNCSGTFDVIFKYGK